MFKKIIIIVFYLCNFFVVSSFSSENKILFKVNNEIISTIDIFNEISYLKLINPNLKSINQENLYDIAKNSLIREHIKKIELEKKNIEINIDENKLNKIKKNFSNRFGLNSNKELEDFLKQKKLNEKDVVKKLIIENLWNSLIVKKFLKDVKIDREKVKREISKIEYQYEYNLSELIFELSNNEKIDDKYREIIDKIKQKSFEEIATLLSVSDSSKTGGLLGWIKENTLNQKIKNELTTLKSGDTTKPIVIPGGILILKINDKRKVEREIDVDKEIQLVIRNKTNKQLNQFSILYFNKIKKDISINEL